MVKTTRRSLLFMPGDDRAKIERGAALDVDSVIIDLEDAVSLQQKNAARDVAARALKELDFGETERLVRINALQSGLAHDDFKAIIDARPHGLVVPKVETAEQLQDVAGWLTRAEMRHAWPDGGIGLIAIVETALGIVNLREIAQSCTRLRALAFGAEDLAGSMGAVRTPDGWEVFYARSAVVLHAKAFGLQAIDTPFVHLKVDDSLLVADCEQALYMGYTGKFAVHPKQVPTIQQAFTPSAAQIDHARRLVDAHLHYGESGVGVFEYEGRMVDMPMVRAAQSVIERARAAGIDV
jgi:citrate lyase beta subunit